MFGWWEFRFVQMKGPALFQGGGGWFRKKAKIHWWNLKIFRTNFIQTWHNASLVEGNSSLFKWRARPFPRVDNYKIAKIHWQNSKIFFSRTTVPISTKFCTMHISVKGIQICSIEEPFNSQKVDLYGFFPLLINVMIKSYVLTDLNCFLRWAMWPMGFSFKFCN